MNERFSIVNARERLDYSLWLEDNPHLDGASRRAVTGHRLWQALCEGRLRAERHEGHRLTLSDLTDPLRRQLFTSPAPLILDMAEFTEWLGTISPLTRLPPTSFVTAVECVSFIAYGAFLTGDDLAAIADAELVQRGTIEVVGAPVNMQWQTAARELFKAHVDARIELIGRKAPCFGAHPISEPALIPVEFFSGGGATVGLTNCIYDRSHADRVMFYEAAVSTAAFAGAFCPANETDRPSAKAATPPRRKATANDDAEFAEWVRAYYDQQGRPPSIKDAERRAEAMGLPRDWAREQRRKLPPELKRARGGKGLTRHLSKPAQAISRN